MTEAKFLVDTNVLVALAVPDHQHHVKVLQWFQEESDRGWGTCAFTDAGFLRVMTNPKVGGLSVAEATEMLGHFANHRFYHSWPISTGWGELSSTLQPRLFGHQQITDAYLLGLAIQQGGVLATLDKGLRYLAGAQYAQNLLLVEQAA